MVDFTAKTKAADSSDDSVKLVLDAAENRTQDLFQRNDRFDSEEFIIPKVSGYPHIQAVVGGKNGGTGFFIPIEQMIKAEWKEDKFGDIVEVVFDEDDENSKADGRLFASGQARMLIVQKTGAFGAVRETFGKPGTKPEIPMLIWNKERANSGEFEQGYLTAITKYLIFFVDENNQLLHRIPFRYNAKGVTMWKLTIILRDVFRPMVDKAYAEYRGKKIVDEMTPTFHACAVFVPLWEREVVGPSKNKQSPILSITGCVQFSGAKQDEGQPHYWKNFFVGYNDEIYSKIVDELQPSKNYWFTEADTKREILSFDGQDAALEPALEGSNQKMLTASVESDDNDAPFDF